VDLRELLPLHFEIKCDIFAFQNTAGMLDGVHYYLKNEMERKEMAENARARVLKEHTYRHRAMEILSLFI
jgi:spore maturation protein CgeB